MYTKYNRFFKRNIFIFVTKFFFVSLFLFRSNTNAFVMIANKINSYHANLYRFNKIFRRLWLALNINMPILFFIVELIQKFFFTHVYLGLQYFHFIFSSLVVSSYLFIHLFFILIHLYY